MPRHVHSVTACLDRKGRLVCEPGIREMEKDADYWRKRGVRLPAGTWEPEDNNRGLRYFIRIPGYTFQSARMFAGIVPKMKSWHESNVRTAALKVLRLQPSGMIEGPPGVHTLPAGARP